MGFGDWLRDTVGKSDDAVRNMRYGRQDLNALGKDLASGETGEMLGNIGKTTRGVAGKAGLIALGAGVLVGAPIAATLFRKQRKAMPMPAPEPLPPVMVDPMAMQQAAPEEESFKWRNRVSAERQGGMGMNVGNPDAPDVDGRGFGIL